MKLARHHAAPGDFIRPSAALSKGPRLRGEVLPDGGDWLLMRLDGVLEQDVRITPKTDDGAFIYVRYAGIRHGHPEVITRLAQRDQVAKMIEIFGLEGAGLIVGCP